MSMPCSLPRNQLVSEAVLHLFSLLLLFVCRVATSRQDRKELISHTRRIADLQGNSHYDVPVNRLNAGLHYKMGGVDDYS